MTLSVSNGVEDADPLDAQLSSLASGKARVRGGRRSRMRLALGLSPTPRPGLVLLLLGMALGPHGLGVLSVPVLTSLDPVLSVALAALGAFVGMDLELRRLREWFLVCVASLESGTTLLVVAAGVLLIHLLSPVSAATPWLMAVMLGICAAPSSTVGFAPAQNVSPARRIGDLDDVLPIVLGVIALAALREGSPTGHRATQRAGDLARADDRGGGLAARVARRPPTPSTACLPSARCCCLAVPPLIWNCRHSLPASSPARSGTPPVQSRANASHATCVICIIR